MPAPTSATHLLPGDPPVAVALRRSPQARRLSLRVSGADGRVTLTFPRRTSLREALAFLASREGWLRSHLARVEPALGPAFGEAIPFAGGLLHLAPASGRRAALEGGTLHLPADRMPARLAAWLKAQARSRLAEATDRHARTLGVRVAAITLRDPRSRWGSCSASGRLMYSWRLVMAPPHVLDYVAAHEVAHLVRLDHSPAFWEVVAGLRPDWPASRDWLRENGSGLHRLRLDG